MSIPRQLERDRIELEQQVVAKRADQRQPAVFGGAEFLDQRTQDRKSGRLLATLLFRKKRRQRLEPSMQAPVAEFELIPVRVPLDQRLEYPVQRFASLVERSKVDIPARGDDFYGRADGCNVPARIAFRILVAGREIDASISIQLM